MRQLLFALPGRPASTQPGAPTTRWPDLVRSMGFVYLTALIMVIGSERFFWFWSTGLGAQFEGAVFYGVATAAGLALMRRFHVTSWWSLLLVTPVIAFVVEGVITPVIYSGGPFVPVFPAWFSFWHGILSFIGLVFGVRHLLLHRSKAATALAAVGLGAFWGVWSTTLWLPENYEDPELADMHGGVLEVLEPAAFTRYALVMTAVFIVAHGVVGFVWPRAGRSSGRTGPLEGREVAVFAVCVLMAAAWTAAVPWALPMFLGYCWLQVRALRWHRSAQTPDAPSLLDGLRGDVHPLALLPLALMAPAAAGVYQLIWWLAPSEGTLRAVMYGIIALQAVAASVLVVKAILDARRAAPEAIDESSTDSEPISIDS